MTILNCIELKFRDNSKLIGEEINTFIEEVLQKNDVNINQKILTTNYQRLSQKNYMKYLFNSYLT